MKFRRNARNSAPNGAGIACAPVVVGCRSVRVGDKPAATLAVTGYPSEVGAGWLEPLLAYPGRLDVSIHIDPIPPAVAADRLRKQRARLESTRRTDAGKGRLDDPELDAAAYDAADLASRLARGDQRLFSVGIYPTVHGTDDADLAEKVTEVRALTSSMLLNTQPVTWRQLQGFTTSLPLGVDRLDMRRTFDTDALAACFPFTSPDLPVPDLTKANSGANLFGLNAASPGVAVWDRWSQDNHNAIILGCSGAGKSYLGKLDLLRNLYLGVEAMVIDPEDEYIELAEAVGGTIIRPGRPGVRINPFDLPGDGHPDSLVRRCMFAHTFMTVLLDAPLSVDEAAALDVAVLAAYRGAGITTDPRTWRRPAPLLGDVAAELAALGGAGSVLAARLNPFVTGSFRGLFDGPTTTHPSGHLIVYAIKGLPDELKAVGTLLILDTIWRAVSTSTSGKRKLVHVDEAWLLLSDGPGARFLMRLAKSIRKYLGGLTVVTQDAGDVLATDLGRAVVANSATQILLRQATQVIEQVCKAFNLTEGERAFLLTCNQGEALLCGAVRASFIALADAFEHTLVVGTGVNSGSDRAHR